MHYESSQYCKSLQIAEQCLEQHIGAIFVELFLATKIQFHASLNALLLIIFDKSKHIFDGLNAFHCCQKQFWIVNAKQWYHDTI